MNYTEFIKIHRGDLDIKEGLSEKGSDITEFFDTLIILDNLDLSCSKISLLSKDLKVEGYLSV